MLNNDKAIIIHLGSAYQFQNHLLDREFDHVRHEHALNTTDFVLHQRESSFVAIDPINTRDEFDGVIE
ncbi:hypothetical protein CSQ95_26620 [Janthinobacterium sp. BJB304]|nr:hypothetical protein CSQ95_26620 [Janthinobacterium sp. BJB304]